MESKTLDTVTTISTIGSNIGIITEYDEPLVPPYIKQTQVTSSSGVLGGVSYKEGDLLITFKAETFPGLVNVVFNSLGELVITGDNASNYSINANGELIYTS